MLFINELSSFIVIGGEDYDEYVTIAKFQNGFWSVAGEMNQPRSVS